MYTFLIFYTFIHASECAYKGDLNKIKYNSIKISFNLCEIQEE